MRQLTLEQVLHALADEIVDDLPRQNPEQNSPDYGAYIPLSSNIPEIGHGGTTRFAVNCGLLALAQRTHPDHAPTLPDSDTLVQRLEIAVGAMLRAQRPSGLIDLRSTNYDSSPDTGFVVQLLCGFVELARGHEPFAAVLEHIDTFIRRAVPGMMTGGFHTPNHRWVIVAALAQSAALYPDLDVKEAIRAYVAEGFDVDEEGTYLERSVGVYDAVTNRSLLHFAENWDDAADIAAVHQAVTANLNLNLHLFHADGTAETGLSRRQDYGTRQVPTPLIATYLQSAAMQPNPVFTRAAQWLWQKARPDAIVNVTWQAYVLMKYGEPEPSPAPLPDNFTAHYPINNLWRLRRGPLSATVFGGVTNLLTLVCGAAELSHVRISQTYFGVGRFIGDELSVDGETVTLRSTGVQRPHKPGYDLPLGRPVSREEWEQSLLERDWVRLPPAESILTFRPTDDGLDCLYRTLDGLDDVTTQIAFDFPAGGLWETDDTALTTQAGQVIFLKAGAGRMRYGNDVIEINPGANAHMYQAMRHSEPVTGDRVRVLLTFVTPVDHRFRIRVYTGL